MDMDICTCCKKNIPIHQEGDIALCQSCMDKLDFVWDSNYYEFAPRYATCPDCGGTMTWCTCCEMYSQSCCVDYGTCQCN